MNTSPLQLDLGYTFKNPLLLEQALTHRSVGVKNNERLEFLGDAFLNCVVAHIIYKSFDKLDEGNLSRARAHLVKQQTLYEIAQKIKLPSYLLLGEGERKSGGFRRPSILADALEAIFAAIFLDSDWHTVAVVIERLYLPIIKQLNLEGLHKDAKTSLQEFLQSHQIPLPQYQMVNRQGVPHFQQFEIECSIPKLQINTYGIGSNRRSAEQRAAESALEEAKSTLAGNLVEGKKRLRSPKAQLSLLGIATRQDEQE